MPTVAFLTVNERTTKGLMAALCNMYEKPSASNNVYLMRRLFNLKIMESQVMDKHLNEFNIMTQLQSVGIDFDDEINALLILSSLPESWDGTVIAVSNSARGEKLRYDEVRDLVFGEEIHKKGNTCLRMRLLSQRTEGRAEALVVDLRVVGSLNAFIAAGRDTRRGIVRI